MARKQKLNGTATVTFKVKQTDGAIPETLDSLEEWIESEWGGLEVYIADPEQDEETVVELEVMKVEITTD
ncbi:hypothetical protein ACFW2V_13280 [Streptomyces sp. NPDC058947]|uniref:hypothetical protein n=1 Tax=Streptomyces sp. NPDC058947 TaxID=3346675 RepID=UPI0036C10E1C